MEQVDDVLKKAQAKATQANAKRTKGAAKKSAPKR